MDSSHKGVSKMEGVSISWRHHVPATWSDPCQGRFWELALDYINLANYRRDYLICAFRHLQWRQRSDLSISYPHSLTSSTSYEICAQFCCALICCGCIINIFGYRLYIHPRSTLKVKCRNFDEIFITDLHWKLSFWQISVQPFYQNGDISLSAYCVDHGSVKLCQSYHDDFIKWKPFLRYCTFMRGIHGSPVDSPHKGQWRGALMFSLIFAWKKTVEHTIDTQVICDAIAHIMTSL